MLVAKREVYSYIEDNNVIADEKVKQIKKSNSSFKVKIFGLALLALIICLGVLFRYAQITQIKMEVSKLDKEIIELKKHKVDISLELERIKESGWIEKEAESRLGMVYPTDEQIVYIAVNDNDIYSITSNSAEEINGKEGLDFLKLFSNLVGKISNKF